MTDRSLIMDEAALWVVRISDNPDSSMRAAFDAWLAQSPEHRMCYQIALAGWERLDGLGSLRLEPADDRIALPPAPPQARRRLAWPRALALAASLAAVIIVPIALLVPGEPALAYATRPGEHREIRLADGSRVELNSNSAIVVRFGHHIREVDLVHGEAAFHVTSGSRRFEVHVRHTVVDMTSGDFGVRLDTDGPRVTVANGLVELSGADARVGPGNLQLAANTVAKVTPDALEVQHLPATEVSRQLTWQNGMLQFDGQSLAEAVTDFNRSNRQQIHIGDPVIGQLHIGGLFRAADINGFADAVALTLPVTVRHNADGDIELTARQPR